jgi:hypothetical protein
MAKSAQGMKRERKFNTKKPSVNSFLEIGLDIIRHKFGPVGVRYPQGVIREGAGFHCEYAFSQ